MYDYSLYFDTARAAGMATLSQMMLLASGKSYCIDNPQLGLQDCITPQGDILDVLTVQSLVYTKWFSH